ncbi:hypothetical protein STTU_5083 [Streptomyces sp. Tu6071]|nr:hypothetical protein STTU_5083 [Streptomyces sp. Tu6071]
MYVPDSPYERTPPHAPAARTPRPRTPRPRTPRPRTRRIRSSRDRPRAPRIRGSRSRTPRIPAPRPLASRGRAVSRLSLALGAAHLAGVVWLGHCATASARNGAWWTTLAFVAGSALLVTAILREHECAEEHVPRPAPVPPPRPVADWQVFEALCCLRAWETRGRAHDPAHCSCRDSLSS